jgi:nitrate/nitrite transport system permease protein
MIRDRLRVIALSLLIFVGFIFVWNGYVLSQRSARPHVDPAYAAMLGSAAMGGPSMPLPIDVATKIWQHLAHPFYDAVPNDKGVGIQIAFSLWRVMIGFTLAAAIAIPLGFLIGTMPLLGSALDPYIQILKPISPLAWMPLALYTIKNSEISAIFVIFICCIWPMVINTAFGVANVRKEWLSVARTIELSRWRTAYEVIFPAAAPTILTAVRISLGIAWLVIVAAEMLVGGTGIGYFVWNEWNNLSLTNVISAIFFIGAVGMLMDQLVGFAVRKVAYEE